jgi:hypothetical protein
VNTTRSPWRRWAFAAGIAACVAIGWLALVRGRPVPVLSLANLGFHELGHLLTYPFPDLVTAVIRTRNQPHQEPHYAFRDGPESVVRMRP